MQRLKILFDFICAILIILNACVCVSNADDQSGKSHRLGDTVNEVFPSAAAHLADVRCMPNHPGAVFTFEVEAFQETWCPIYSIEIEQVGSFGLEPVSCPIGWSATLDSLKAGGKVIFTTQTNPLLPGTSMGMFGIRSTSNHTMIRWHPCDGDGILVGKVTLEEFSCPTQMESKTWGLLKAIYSNP